MMVHENAPVRIYVKEEDIDWRIYHVIVQEKNSSLEKLVDICGYESSVVQASINRLRQYLLIDYLEGEDCYRACDVGEIMLKNQLKDCFTDGLELSGGIIRFRPTGGDTGE